MGALQRPGTSQERVQEQDGERCSVWERLSSVAGTPCGSCGSQEQRPGALQEPSGSVAGASRNATGALLGWAGVLLSVADTYKYTYKYTYK